MEFSTPSTAMNLLEMLRRGVISFDPSVDEDNRRKIKLIANYRKDFPSKLRVPIQVAVAPPERPSSTVLWEIQSAVQRFFMGQSIVWDPSLEDEWHGPDKDIDTEAEVELTARLFPLALTELDEDSFPIVSCMTSPKAVYFVPIMTKVVLESNNCRLDDNHLLDQVRWVLFNNRKSCTNRLAFSITSDLRNEDGTPIITRGDYSTYRKPSAELDNACLTALDRMRDLGLLDLHHLQRLLSHLFDEWNSDTTRKMLKDADVLDFFQTRFRFLLESDPSLLETYGSEEFGELDQCPKRQGFWVSLISNFDKHDSEVMDSIIRMVCQHGLSHYPRQLGFIFSQNYCHLYMRSDAKAPRLRAMKRVYEIGREEIATAMRKNNRVARQWVYAVATNTVMHSADELLLQRTWFPNGFVNTDVSPDGLYSLIRSDPIGVLKPSHFFIDGSCRRTD